MSLESGSPPHKPANSAAAAAERHLQPRGSSQGGLRQYNERVVLQAIRLQGALPSADIARLTQLTPQTISLISKRLIEDGLLLRGEPQRGRVGQPSVPLSLNPDGAFSIGIKVGRRSLDTLLVDFTGAPRERWSLDYPHADPAQVLAEINLRLKAVRRHLGSEKQGRVQGVGIAAPLAMGGWQQLLGLPPHVAEQWARFDLREAVQAASPWPVSLTKDTAAACVAELVAGQGRKVSSFLYIFVDTFIGGGLVLDGQWRPGSSGNAGAVGSLPLGLSRAAGSKRASSATPPEQLLGVASLLNLERRYTAAGLEPHAAADERALQAPWRPHTQAWLDESATAIAHAVNSAAGLLDLDGVIVDGSFGRPLLQALLDGLHTALQRYSWEGVSRPALLAGSIGSDARALGGALLPLHASFALDRDLFLKQALA